MEAVFGFGGFGGFAYGVEEAVKVDKSVNGVHFACAGGYVDPVDDAALGAAAKEGPGFLHEFAHDFNWGGHDRHGK